jgi:uncharacterized protein YqeY
MEERIQKDIMSAMKEKDEVRLTALRAVKTAIMQTKTSPNFKGDRDANLPDADVLKIMQKLAKEREESYNIYITAGRNDLADKEYKEMLIIKEYLPKPLTEEELNTIVKETIEEMGASTMKDMGRVMGMVSQKTNGRADGKVVSMIVKKLLS